MNQNCKCHNISSSYVSGSHPLSPYELQYRSSPDIKFKLYDRVEYEYHSTESLCL
jgi:hypothetical protein